MIEITDTTYVAKIWMLARGDSDWMCVVAREKDDPDGQWTITYRWRYYVDDKAHDSNDRKVWSRGIVTDVSELEVVTKTDMIAELLAATVGGKLDATVIGGGSEVFAEKVEGVGYFHVASVEVGPDAN